MVIKEGEEWGEGKKNEKGQVRGEGEKAKEDKLPPGWEWLKLEDLGAKEMVWMKLSLEEIEHWCKSKVTLRCPIGVKDSRERERRQQKEGVAAHLVETKPAE